MQSSERAGRKSDTSHLTGWLFADLMLILFVIMLSIRPAGVVSTTMPPTARTSSTPTAGPSSEQTPTPTPTSRVVTSPGVELRPRVERFVVAGLSNAAVKAEMRSRFATLERRRRRAAFVLTFGTDPSPGLGIQLAGRANNLLEQAVPGIFSGSARRDFWQRQGAPNGVVSVEVYLFTKN